MAKSVPQRRPGHLAEGEKRRGNRLQNWSLRALYTVYIQHMYKYTYVYIISVFPVLLTVSQRVCRFLF